jgi:hypothetical protein
MPSGAPISLLALPHTFQYLRVATQTSVLPSGSASLWHNPSDSSPAHIADLRRFLFNYVNLRMPSGTCSHNLRSFSAQPPEVHPNLRSLQTSGAPEFTICSNHLASARSLSSRPRLRLAMVQWIKPFPREPLTLSVPLGRRLWSYGLLRRFTSSPGRRGPLALSRSAIGRVCALRVLHPRSPQSVRTSYNPRDPSPSCAGPSGLVREPLGSSEPSMKPRNASGTPKSTFAPPGLRCFTGLKLRQSKASMPRRFSALRRFGDSVLRSSDIGPESVLEASVLR